MKNVKIIIEGKAGSGRTQMALVIEDALRDAGFTNVELVNREELSQTTLDRLREMAGSSLSLRDMKVLIDDSQLPREG